jgi:very-short-patch-repair endonuclease
MPSPKPTRADRRSELKRGFAKYLRANPTDAERRLWQLLRGKQVAHLRFRRQQPVGSYIADFLCPAAKLIIELDGGQHTVDKMLPTTRRVPAGWKVAATRYYVLQMAKY